MKTRAITIIGLSLFLSGILFTSCKGTQSKSKEKVVTENHPMKHARMGNDHRISLNLSPQKAQHQLMNMRNHLIAIQSIVNYLSKDNYEKASEIASSQLGLTEEMEMMCSSFGNEEFEKLGLAFHNSADKMSEVFKKKDKNESLEALSTTMNACVTCHTAFKQ